MCVAYKATLAGKEVVLKTPLPDTAHAEVAANDLEVSEPTTIPGVRVQVDPSIPVLKDETREND